MKRLVRARRRRRQIQAERKWWVHVVGCVLCVPELRALARADPTRGRGVTAAGWSPYLSAEDEERAWSGWTPAPWRQTIDP